MPTMAAISGTASAPHAFCGDASSRNEKSGNLTSCLLAGGVLFRPLAIRYDVFPGHRGCDTPGVRKHRAPKGALVPSVLKLALGTQKAPSAKRCIKTRTGKQGPADHHHRQKAPSTKRCIKTYRR